MRDVQAAAGKLRDLRIARDADGFGGSGHSHARPDLTELLPSRITAPANSEAFFAVVHHAEIQRMAVVHHLAQQFGGSDWFAVIAYRDDTCFLHGGNFRQRFAFASDRSRSNRPDPSVAGGSGALLRWIGLPKRCH